MSAIDWKIRVEAAEERVTELMKDLKAGVLIHEENREDLLKCHEITIAKVVDVKRVFDDGSRSMVCMGVTGRQDVFFDDTAVYLISQGIFLETERAVEAVEDCTKLPEELLRTIAETFVDPRYRKLPEELSRKIGDALIQSVPEYTKWETVGNIIAKP